MTNDEPVKTKTYHTMNNQRYPSTTRFWTDSMVSGVNRGAPWSLEAADIHFKICPAKHIRSHSEFHSATVNLVPVLDFRADIPNRNKTLSMKIACLWGFIVKIWFHKWLPRAHWFCGPPSNSHRSSNKRALEKAAGFRVDMYVTHW